MGRPSALTPEVGKTILRAIREGADRGAAARAAGVAPSTLRGWLQREEEPYSGFKVALEKAEGALEVEAARLVFAAARRTPAWAAWYLERKSPDVWGRRRLEITGADGGPVEVSFDPSKLTDEQLREIRDGKRGPEGGSGA